ncbi:MAG: N-acetylneuraminate synthase [Candidatus Thorarchaeota archaeon]
MSYSIKFGNRRIGDGEPVFIIAEAGVNHNGDLRIAKKLVDDAAASGVDAVKFQTFKTENLTTKEAAMAEYQKDQAREHDSQFDMIKRLELSYDSFVELKEYCDEKGILFLSTPHSADAIDFLDSIMPAYKIGSGDLTNLPFLKLVASKGKPIFLSTGMSSLREVREAVQAIQEAGGSELLLLHCLTNYPSDIRDSNLRAMDTLKREFNLPVGFSDHTMGIIASVAAVAMGACMIEKHFTTDRNLPGPDHKASLEPNQLRELVDSIRNIEAALGTGIKEPTKEEIKIREIARKSLVSITLIPEGAIITREMIDIKRPGIGIAPKHLEDVVGKRAIKEIQEDSMLTWDMIE